MLKKFAKVVLGVILLAIGLRVCFFDVFKVPSDSMKNALSAGNLIIINKTLFTGPFAKVFSKLNVTDGLKRNDILVFKTNDQDSSFYVKRCVCLPGQTIAIRNGVVIIDNRPTEDPSTVRHYFMIWYSNYTLTEQTLAKSNIDLKAGEFKRLPKFNLVYLNTRQKEYLLGKPGIDSVTIFNEKPFGKMLISNMMAHGSAGLDLSPLQMPYAGMKIRLCAKSVYDFRNILKEGEAIDIKQKAGDFWVDGVKQQFYVFKKSYYFMMGDNRENSIDSRVFGPIANDCIQGKVVLKI